MIEWILVDHTCRLAIKIAESMEKFFGFHCRKQFSEGLDISFYNTKQQTLPICSKTYFHNTLLTLIHGYSSLCLPSAEALRDSE